MTTDLGDNQTKEKITIISNTITIRILIADMKKVENLPPADFQVKSSAYWENQGPLLECTNFWQISENFR
jgi:hypothetical protein